MVSNTLRRVVECIAAATRYPTELLAADADLENDLGIDSVKNLEILLALSDAFQLELTKQTRDPAVRTLGQVAQWIDGLLAHRGGPATAAAPHLSAGQPPAAPIPSPSGHAVPQARTSHLPNHVDILQRQPPEIRPAALNAAPAARVDGRQWTAPQPHWQLPRGHAQEQVEEYQPRRNLHGQVALVTGSGRGVGRTIAMTLAARGAQVIINSFHSRELGEQTAAEINARGGRAIHVWGSVANPEHVTRMFADIDEHFGQLDILVCNASDGRIGPFMELTPKDWERAFFTNVAGHHQCAVEASRFMRACGGSIVTMSAVGADRYIEGLGSQGVVKAAVETLTRYLACELGHYGIRVNCVSGGPVYGELLSKFPAAAATQRHWEAMTPDGQLCTPTDLANTISFLVSDEARGINGAVWMVDHGFSATADGRPLRRSSPERVRAAFV